MSIKKLWYTFLGIPEAAEEPTPVCEKVSEEVPVGKPKRKPRAKKSK